MAWTSPWVSSAITHECRVCRVSCVSCVSCVRVCVCCMCVCVCVVCRVCGVEAERVRAGIGRCDSLEDLLASCDVVSLNCDLNADNHHLLNAATLSHIPKNKGVRPHTHDRTRTRTTRTSRSHARSCFW